MSKRNWQVYIILCSDDSLYTGITTDVARRFSEHARGRGAKYFRGRAPLRVVYTETRHSRPSASQREYAIKQMSRPQKALLISGRPQAPPPPPDNEPGLVPSPSPFTAPSTT